MTHEQLTMNYPRYKDDIRLSDGEKQMLMVRSICNG